MKRMSWHHHVLLALSICGASAGAALADPSDGPFTNESSLISYWEGFATASAIAIYYNGHVVYQRSGFGPPLTKVYWQCSSDVREDECPNIQAGTHTLSYLENTFGPNASWYLDNTLIRSGTYSLKMMTCTGDSAFGYPALKYYLITFSNASGFSPPYVGTGVCF